ncbi:MAG: hypothetical protein RIS35_2747, partial [Pseudomonadota bacterium]
GGLASPRLAVLDEFGTTLGTAIDDLLTDPAPRFTLKSPSGGTHFVQVASNLAPTMTGGYRLRVDEVDDHPDDPTVGTEILVDSAIDGRIGAARDVDWFRVAFSAGQTYAITLDRTGAAPVLNPFLVLRLPDGTTVTNSDAVWGEWNSRLEFAAPVDGTYAIQASDTLQQETGGYRLAIARLEVDDHGSTVETATRISAGTFVDGALERDDDQDWFRVDLIAGLDYEFRLETNTATGGLGTPRISVLDASGATLGTATDDLLIDPAPTLTVRPDSGGAHFLQVTSTPAQDMTGTYRVRVREVDDRPAGEVGALEVGASVSGRIAPAGDDDRFAVNLVEGDRYVLRLETTLGALNPAVTVIAPDGTSFRATREEGAAAELQYTAPVTGRYEVRADDKSGQGTGNYALSITREETPPVRDLKVQRLEGAFIYADLNGNNRADPEEDTGLSTDTRGLATGALPTNVSLLAIGGVNIDTGLPNRLTLIAPAGGTLISPLTTAVEHVQDLSGRSTSEARMLVARVLGLDPGIDLLEYDPLAQAPGDPAALAVQKAAVQVAVMADGLRNGDQLFARLAALSIERSTTPDLTLLETLAFLTDRQPSGLELRAVAGWIEALQSIDSATELPQAQKEWTAALLLLSVLEEFGVWVQDGYVAGATLFADLNENNRPDPWEDTGLVTNAGGLAEGLLPTNASLIAVGGTNIDTGLPNTLTLMAPAGGGLVNPITTLMEFAGDLSGLGIDASREKISAALGLDPGIDPLTYDPLAQPPGDPLALAVQKAAVRIAVVAGAVGSPSANLFRLAALSVESAVPIDLTNAETLAEVLDLEVDDPLLGAIATGLDTIEAAETLSSVAEAQAAATVALDLAILPAISISTTRLEVAEGDAGATLLAFRVDRTGDLTGASSLQWRVEGDQIDTSDFVGGVLPSGTLDFAVGEAAKTITIEARGDTAFEADEPVTVTLVSATGARIETAAAQVTILNDDALPLLSIAATDATRNEGNGGTTDFTFTVTRSGDTSGAASANWAAGSAIGMQASSPEGNATAADADFEGGTLPSGTIRFAAGETSKTISIAVVGDAAFEADEAFTVTLSAPSGATLGTVTA